MWYVPYSMAAAESHAGVARQACMFFRNAVVRNPENKDPILAKGAEPLLRKAKALHPKDCMDVSSAAMRDLGCKNYNEVRPVVLCMSDHSAPLHIDFLRPDSRLCRRNGRRAVSSDCLLMFTCTYSPPTPMSPPIRPGITVCSLCTCTHLHPTQLTPPLRPGVIYPRMAIMGKALNRRAPLDAGPYT